MKAIVSLLLIIAAFILICYLSGCSQAYHCSKCLTPPTIETKSDTTVKEVFTPYYIALPGDTIFITGNVTRPCPDSTKAWAQYNYQINQLLNQNAKYFQSISMDRDNFSLILRIKDDSIKALKDSVNRTIMINTTKVDQFYRQGYLIQQEALKKYKWIVISGGLIILLLLGVIGWPVIKKMILP